MLYGIQFSFSLKLLQKCTIEFGSSLYEICQYPQFLKKLYRTKLLTSSTDKPDKTVKDILVLHDSERDINSKIATKNKNPMKHLLDNKAHNETENDQLE